MSALVDAAWLAGSLFVSFVLWFLGELVVACMEDRHAAAGQDLEDAIIDREITAFLKERRESAHLN